MTALRGRAGRLGLGRTRPAAVGDRLAALDQVIELGRNRMDEGLVSAAERVAGKAGERLRLGPEHTVVALAGATGSGKSSLFNALAGAPLSDAGMRRPTTGTALAAVWGGEDAGPLLDWLGIHRRHAVAAAPGTTLHGLVLLDLPDVDSVRAENRLEADRLVERADLMVWVLDPQKYADAAVHDRYLRPLAGHSDVMMVALNQVDLLPEVAREGCLADLGRLLASEGLEAVPVLPVSARTGAGVEALRGMLAARVAAKHEAVRRLEADLTAIADALAEQGLRPAAGGQPARVRPAEREALVSALGDAAGVGVVAEAVGAAHRLRARRVTGWPVTRWTSRLRRDPARRLHLRDTPSELVRTALPGPSPSQRAAIDTALRELAAVASEGLPQPWPSLVRRTSAEARGRLPDLLDRAVAGTDLGLDRTPRWWHAARLLQWLFLGCALVGLLWLAALFAVAWLQLPDPPLPRLGPVPVPTLMLLAGLTAGVLLAVLSRMLSAAGARRRIRTARSRLLARVEEVAGQAVVEPVDQELQAHARLCAALAALRG